MRFQFSCCSTNYWKEPLEGSQDGGEILLFIFSITTEALIISPLFTQVYHSLAQSRNVNIKQTLAYSLHEVAKILQDQQLVEAELVPVFEHFIQAPPICSLIILDVSTLLKSHSKYLIRKLKVSKWA